MDKIHYQTDQEDLFRLCDGQMFTLYDDANIKSAASDTFTRELLSQHKPDKDHFMLHVVAMGDQATFGSNKNGDAFPKEALEKYHDTFVKNGCFFREHKNRCQETQGIGTIKASAFNQKMHRVELVVHGNKKKAAAEYEKARAGKSLSFSMSCFPAGTLVTMADGAEKEINLLSPGEQVVTHRGNIGTITHIMNRQFTGSAVNFRAAGLPEAVTCTPDHGVWVRPTCKANDPCPVCGGRFKSLKAHLWQKKDAQHVKAFADYSRFTEGFIGANLIRPGDFVRTAVTPYAPAVCAKSCMPRLLGLYLAEGSVSAIKQKYKGEYRYLDYRSEFTFNIAETALVEETKDLIEQFAGKRPSSFDYPAEHRTLVRSHSVELYNWLLEHGNKYSHNKQLSSHAMGWKPEELKQVLEAWMEGDGHFSVIHEHLVGTTVSRKLAFQIMEIAARNNISSSVNAYKSKNKKTAYTIAFSGPDTAKLNVVKIPEGWTTPAAKFKKVGHLRHQKEGQMSRCAIKTSAPQSYVENGFIYRRVNKAKTVWLDEVVYDITVPGDSGFMVHKYGVSNCRVPYDICSCCEKKASSPRNYCSHLSDHMLEYLPEFKKYAFAINDRPNFFDISVVANPADRIAHYLDYAFPDSDQEKSASANKGIITGTEWASFEGVKLPGEHIPAWNLKEHEMLTKLAACEKYILDTFIYKKATTTDAKASFVRNIIPQAFTGDELSDTEISKLRTLQVGTVFGELAKRATLLPFNSFTAYVTGRTMEDVSNDPVTKRACCMLSTIFNKLINSDSGCDLDKMFNAGSNYSCEQDPGNDDEVQKFMDAVSDKFCIKTAPVSSRVITVTISKGASTKAPQEGNIVLTENFEKRALALAEIYGVYKLNAMLDIKAAHGDEIDEPQYLLAVGQNFEL